MKRNDSKFMSDHSEGDHGLEAILDYELSWVLRMAADDDCRKNQPKLHHQCEHILFKLLTIDNPEKITIKRVHVWKQWRYVDLVADIYLEENNAEKLYVLMTEDKAYMPMSQNQRDKYPDIVKEAYNTYPQYSDYRGKYELRKVLVTCFSSEPNEDGYAGYIAHKEFVKNTDWKVMSIDELPDWSVNEQTESDLFNEFWFNNWKQL